MTATLEELDFLDQVDDILSDIDDESTPNPMIDVPLLRKAVEWAENEAEKGPLFSDWQQGAWILQTTHERAQQLARGEAEYTEAWAEYSSMGYEDDETTEAFRIRKDAAYEKFQKVWDLKTLELEDKIKNGPTACGTAYCVAGYVAAMTDVRHLTTDIVNDVHAEEFARAALGLTYDQSELLFNGNNTIEEVRTFAESIAGERL